LSKWRHDALKHSKLIQVYLCWDILSIRFMDQDVDLQKTMQRFDNASHFRSIIRESWPDLPWPTLFHVIPILYGHEELQVKPCLKSKVFAQPTKFIHSCNVHSIRIWVHEYWSFMIPWRRWLLVTSRLRLWEVSMTSPASESFAVISSHWRSDEVWAETCVSKLCMHNQWDKSLTASS
jgi:hypothetical protein